VIQQRESLGTLGDTFLHIDGRIEIASFRPQLLRLCGMAGIVFQQGQSSDRICQLELRSLFVTAVNLVGLAVVRFGEVRTSVCASLSELLSER